MTEPAPQMAGCDQADEMDRLSSALTLSDLELIAYPELLYGLVLANVISPALWRWREDPWFEGILSLSPYRRVLRVKQYVMDHYRFHLDLDTWGLTSKQRELARFKNSSLVHQIARFSPFFGCHGAKHYFELDVRKQFGLCQLPDDAIPYWKTETIEAMDAFKHRDAEARGAGECVSFAALYAAALFVVARIPLESTYLMLTPLHCQGFVDLDGGLLLNNRRVVTKRMWFNGTELSARARRALTHEEVILVAHASGSVRAGSTWGTIAPAAYQRFRQRLTEFVNAPLDTQCLLAFLRQRVDLQERFQVRLPGSDGGFLALEDVFASEQPGRLAMTDATRGKLLAKVAESGSRSTGRLLDRVLLDDLEQFLRQRQINPSDKQGLAELLTPLAPLGTQAHEVARELASFCSIQPRLPDPVAAGGPVSPALNLRTSMTREEILRRLLELRAHSPSVEAALHCHRDLRLVSPLPVIKAAVERSPVCVQGTQDMSFEAIVHEIERMPNRSIYLGAGRLAQPDEVWNFGRGDGVEKALLLAAIRRARSPREHLVVRNEASSAVLVTEDGEIGFGAWKGLGAEVWAIPEARSVGG